MRQDIVVSEETIKKLSDRRSTFVDDIKWFVRTYLDLEQRVQEVTEKMASHKEYFMEYLGRKSAKAETSVGSMTIQTKTTKSVDDKAVKEFLLANGVSADLISRAWEQALRVNVSKPFVKFYPIRSIENEPETK